MNKSNHERVKILAELSVLFSIVLVNDWLKIIPQTLLLSFVFVVIILRLFDFERRLKKVTIKIFLPTNRMWPKPIKTID